MKKILLPILVLFFLTITAFPAAAQRFKKGTITVIPQTIEVGKPITISAEGLGANEYVNLKITGGTCTLYNCGTRGTTTSFGRTDTNGKITPPKEYSTWPADPNGTQYQVLLIYGQNNDDATNEVVVELVNNVGANPVPGQLKAGDDCTDRRLYNACPLSASCQQDTTSLALRFVCGGKSAYTEQTCNETTQPDQIVLCTAGTKRVAVQRCGVNLKGFTCPDTAKQRFCMKASPPSEANVECEVIPPFPPPCSKWVYKNGAEVPKELVATTVEKKCVEVVTGLGGPPISTDPVGFVKSIFGIILSLSGGIALLLIIFSGYKLMLSQGNPEKAQEAKETLTAAIVGLLFIIFSLVILQVIGVDILRIPGFQ